MTSSPPMHRPERWTTAHYVITRLLEADGLTRRGLAQLHDDLTLGVWRESVIPEGFRVQADALRRRIERLLQHEAEGDW